MPPLRRQRTAAAALTMALLLLTAPVRVALGLGCDLCPPDCPMHVSAHAEADGDDHTPVMRCHASPQAGHATVGSLGHRLTRPPCGSHAAVVGLDLTSLLPAAPPAWPDAPAVAHAAERRQPAGNRGADPPDTPPPLARA